MSTEKNCQDQMILQPIRIGCETNRVCYYYSPQSDITAPELASALELVLLAITLGIGGISDFSPIDVCYRRMPPEVQRHFQVSMCRSKLKSSGSPTGT